MWPWSCSPNKHREKLLTTQWAHSAARLSAFLGIILIFRVVFLLPRARFAVERFLLSVYIKLCSTNINRLSRLFFITLPMYYREKEEEVENMYDFMSEIMRWIPQNWSGGQKSIHCVGNYFPACILVHRKLKWIIFDHALLFFRHSKSKQF